MREKEIKSVRERERNCVYMKERECLSESIMESHDYLRPEENWH